MTVATLLLVVLAVAVLSMAAYSVGSIAGLLLVLGVSLGRLAHRLIRWCRR